MTGPNLSALAVRHQSLTLFLLIVTAIAGTYAFFQLGRAEDPRFTIKAMVVTAAWPGASAEEMQQQVADPMEKQLQELRWFDRVETTTRPGLAVMEVHLADDTPAEAVPDQWYQVRKKLGDEAPRLPRGVLGPFFDDEFSDTYFALFSLTFEGLPLAGQVALAERVRDRLLAVPGVAKINILGEQPQQLRVALDHGQLQALGIATRDVADAIAAALAVVPDGMVETAGPAIAVRLAPEIAPEMADPERIRRIPLSAGGRTLTVGDIATVTSGKADPPAFLIRQDGTPAILLGVVMQTGWNGLTLGRDLAREVEAIGETMLPLGIDMLQVADQAQVIDAAYGEFMTKFAAALGVVLLVSLIALGFRVGLVVAAAVPLTLGIVFVIMLLTDRDFDRITLGALILSLGLLVDDAIIAIEMMVVKMAEGLDRMAAAVFAWGATAAPMLSGTLVTIAGFIPIGFAASSSGEYAGNIFWILAFALVASWFVAVYFTPWLGVKLLPDIRPVAGGHDAIYQTPRYRQLRSAVTWTLAHRGKVIAATVIAFLLAALAMAAVEKQFFPSSDRRELLIDVELPAGSSIEATGQAVLRLERWLADQHEARMVTAYVGGGAARFFTSLDPEAPDPAFAKIVIQTPSADDRVALKARVRAAIDDGLVPEARVRASELLLGPPVRYPVVFRVHGPDIAELRRIAGEVRAAVATSPQVRDVHLDHGERVPELRIRFDPARLAAIGLTPEAAGRQVATALSGETIAQLRRGNRTVDVVLRAADADRRSIARLSSIAIVAADGSRMPLANVGEIVVDAAEPVLRRWSREPFIAVRADTADGVQPPDATAAILPLLDGIQASLPEGYSIRTGGAVEESAKANAAIAATAPATIGIMLLLIMLQVRSFRLMGLTIATAPLGLIGAAFALLIFRQPFGFVAILGLIGLAGILMRNTLILVDQVQADQAAGLSDREAIVETTVRRARPVVLTALAAVLAFAPLTFSTFWGPLAFVLIGGVSVGTALTLFFLPALTAVVLRVPRTPPRDLAVSDTAMRPAT
ncbi:MAG: efflux RND transporter permease subunit [Sphingomonadaceae bacterium]